MDNVRTGKFIAELRRQKGLTQQQLADQMHLSNKTISKWESGMGSPDISNLPVLAQCLDVSVDELLSGERRAEENGSEASAHRAAEARKREHAVTALTACIGAVLGILAYNLGWLG